MDNPIPNKNYIFARASLEQQPNPLGQAMDIANSTNGLYALQSHRSGFLTAENVVDVMQNGAVFAMLRGIRNEKLCFIVCIVVDFDFLK